MEADIEQVDTPSENGDPSVDRPYPCGSSTGPCSWPVCDSGDGCQFGDGSFTGVAGYADPVSREVDVDDGATRIEPHPFGWTGV